MKKAATWKRLRAADKRERRRLARVRVRAAAASRKSALRARLASIAPAQPHPDPKQSGRRVRVITPPLRLDLDENYEATIKLLRNIRFATTQLRGEMIVDLKVLEDISPAAALLLVAECDRWREKTKAQRLNAFEVWEWTPSVRRRLKEMGFFKVLNSRNIPDDPVELGADRYVPFLTGHRNPGVPAAELRQSIEALGPNIADREALYEGLVEAMTNVTHHAYQSETRDFGPERWWISASVNPDRHTMTVMVVDHGVGIAKTLPRSSTWESILKAVPLDMLKYDPYIVRAAFAKDGVNKSQTGEVHRGKGLRQNIKGYVECHNSRGKLRVITNKASYTYSRHNEREVEEAISVPVPFGGTFIEWTIEDYGQA
ncbi:hypothetical protein EDF77_1940 [Stenotrophomonas maltophilia]|uniref:hypothetical protein n=1 Tax=Stenotrophomonas chelatiphaga TaxID=517011 RepID=UPI000F4C3D50|nr:hypothetical protein [Stenotrophomonas chelatiphaga]MCS4231348.1 anti-anti-sigma regulatory factor [Stenotrophomonas chelatiphaga]ROQ42465.1 hypothetical protein EDF77_1940 [Stenotrophomonas maltophilia]